jgi:two-component system sensor histidine kinase BaeS
MKYSLRSRLSLSYAVVALLLVAAVSFATNFLLESEFKRYIIRQQEARNREIVNMIGRQYEKADGSWNVEVIENIGVSALEQGLIVKVTDKNGETVWDATTHNSGLCAAMIAHMSENMASRYPNFKGAYAVESYPALQDYEEAGLVEIGYYGPYYFNDSDLAFITTLNRLLVWAGLISLIAALLFGAFMARRLSVPITRVIGAARQISKGYFGGRITEKSNTREISQLISSVNQMSEALEKQEALRKRLTADVAHELRTPLASLQGYLEAMVDGIWTPDTERLKGCHEEIVRISRLVSDLEKLARYEGEELQLNKTRFDLYEAVRHIVHSLEVDFAKKGVSLRYSGGKAEIYADRDKMSQVVVNLLSNALKFTPSGGSVEVEVGETGEGIFLCVSDTGIGISQDDLPNIFERFYRADKSRSRASGGSGIGLAIVKVVISAHMGSVSVQSEPGKGAAFRVFIPFLTD